MTQQQALDILKLGHNIYLTGAAGSGKTFLLNAYIDFLKKKNVEVAVTASTGIAATHMNGMTIHSWSGMGIKEKMSEADILKLYKKSYLQKRFDKTKVLIIDEVSMLHPFHVDLVDKICRIFKQDHRPFGGIQTIFCGDFFQLPPVRKDGAPANFINKSEVWQKIDLKICYLQEQHRQADNELTTILNDIRNNNIGEHTLIPLRQRYKKEVAGSIAPAKLYTHNIDVEAINLQELNKLDEKLKTFVMNSRGNEVLVDILKNSCLAPERLSLKKGATVMFVKNSREQNYVNGTMGVVVDFDDSKYPIVQTKSGEQIIATPVSWTIEEHGDVKAEIMQVPLRLAWAITVHKSQGMSLDCAEVDLSKSFETGMGYVALSRVRSLSGLKLMGMNKTALQVNPEVLELDKELLKQSTNSIKYLQTLKPTEKEQAQKDFLQSIAPKFKSGEGLSRYEKTKVFVLQKLSLEEIAQQRGLAISTVIRHLEKLLSDGEKLDISYLFTNLEKDRLEKIKKAFTKTGDISLSPVKEILGDDFSYDELKLSRLFLAGEGFLSNNIKKQ